jgi:hypothetical protein
MQENEFIADDNLVLELVVNNSKFIEMPKPNKNSSATISFPTWKEIINCFIEENSQKDSFKLNDFKNKLEFFQSNARMITDDMASKSVSMAMQMMIGAAGEYVPGETLDSIIPRIKESGFSSNEFYTVFDLLNSTYCLKDESLISKLGIKPENFELYHLLGISGHPFKVHDEDLPHFIRWAGVAFLLFSLPGFTFQSNKDHFIIKFRVNVTSSEIPEIAELKYVTLEKKCFLSNDSVGNNEFIPRYHFDRWSIIPSSDDLFVKPQFVSDFQQSTFMNGLNYLFNASLLNFPIKYLLMLEERILQDRNKGISNEINRNILQHSGIKSSFDEYQIGDYMAKTIRPKLTELVQKWDSSQSSKTIENDNQAIHQAQKLGLLPIPEKIKTLIYSRVGE